jgi:anti-sigma-K factor RskA
MSDTDKTPEDINRDDPMIAAEWALGLLEGEELLDARGKYASDPNFAWRKGWWDNWFAPLTDDMAGAEPGAHVWQGIAAALDGSEARAGGEVVALKLAEAQARTRRWQWTAAITSAAAAVLLAVMVLGPQTTPDPAPTGTPQLAITDPLVAQVPIGETGLRLDVTYIPETEEMLVGAIGLTADGVHDHELWLVPADGSALQSLGVVTPGEVARMDLPEDVTRNLASGVELVLTREPIGGKPEGQDAGPVVAQGAFSQV